MTYFLCVCVGEQALKQGLREVFAVYVKFATEFEEQRKQLLEEVKQAIASLNEQHVTEIQGELVSRDVEFSTINMTFSFRVNDSQWPSDFKINRSGK